MKAELRELLGRVSFDLVQFEYSHMGQYLNLVPPSLPRGIIFIDLVTPVLGQWTRITRGVERAYYRRQERLTRRREEGYAAAAGSLTLSEKDRKILESWRPGLKARVLPLLLEGELYSNLPGESEAGNILFVGAMHRPVNIDAALLLKERVLPLLARTYPDYRCYIVGHNPPSSLKKLSTDRFIVTGSVPRIRPYLARAAVVAVPLRVAGGVIVKILQAMAAGRPVVATAAANAGIGAEDGKEILIADRPEEIADRLRELLEDPRRGREIARAGREFFQRKFNLESNRKKMDSIYRELMEQKDEPAK
jgi:glycosyltransferase involved in cell wall biosynthesis